MIPVFTFYIQGVLKFKKKKSVAKRFRCTESDSAVKRTKFLSRNVVSHKFCAKHYKSEDASKLRSLRSNSVLF